MKKIVIMAGGFHPFHAGHYALYQSAKKKFPDADIYLAASNDTKTRPFPFEIKKKLAQLAGVDPNKFVQVKSPFRPIEIVSKYDPEQTALIYVRSEKDRNEEPIPGTVKKDGSPSYLQPYNEKKLEPLINHAYMDYLPTVEFGPGIKSATEIRTSWPRLNEKQKLAMVMSLYPKTQTNRKLADVAVKMLDAGINNSQLAEEKEEKQDLNPRDILATPDEQEILSFVRKHYPEAPSTQAAFIKYVLHSLEHSKEDSEEQQQEIDRLNRVLQNLERTVKNIKNNIENMPNADSALGETTLVNDPDQGLQIIPDGGQGSYDEASLVSNISRSLARAADLLKTGNYKEVYHLLYKSKGLEYKVASLAEYDNFKAKQGKRPIAMGKEIDIGLQEGEADALQYATKAHANQKRAGGMPYISHPISVANHVRQYKKSHNLDALISAAYLHDTLEDDPNTTHEILHDLFGGLVASLVKELTSDPAEVERLGKANYLSQKMATMSSYALVIKLADRLDNVKDIATAKTPEWRERYKAETNHILDYIERNRVLSGTHMKLISLIREKIKDITPEQIDHTDYISEK